MPVRLTAPLDEARTVVLAALEELPEADRTELRLHFGEVTDKLVWLTVTALTPPDTNVAALPSELLERSLAALREAERLPTGVRVRPEGRTRCHYSSRSTIGSMGPSFGPTSGSSTRPAR